MPLGERWSRLAEKTGQYILTRLRLTAGEAGEEVSLHTRMKLVRCAPPRRAR